MTSNEFPNPAQVTPDEYRSWPIPKQKAFDAAHPEEMRRILLEVADRAKAKQEAKEGAH